MSGWTARGRALRWTSLLLAVIVLAGVRDASQRVPIGPASGVVFAERAAKDSDKRPATIRVGTYNIHGGRGTDGKYDLQRIAKVLEGCNFVGLNEVYGPALWEDEDQAASLGRLLQLTSRFAPTEKRWHHLTYGNGWLANLEVRDWRAIPLERRYGKSFRNFIHVRAWAPNGTPIELIVTHIDRSDDRERREQLRVVGEYFLAIPEPAVLLGDLNSDALDPGLEFVLTAPGVIDAVGKKFGADAPRHIDWILVRGAAVTDAGITPAGPSDHGHVWATISVDTSNSRLNAEPATNSPRLSND